MGEGRMSSYGKCAALLILLALPLAGCGIKGSLDAPPEAKATGTVVAPDAKGTAKGSKGPKKRHRPSILDGLLR
jgi:predicted small lipoprotein YifL